MDHANSIDKATTRTDRDPVFRLGWVSSRITLTVNCIVCAQRVGGMTRTSPRPCRMESKDNLHGYG